MKVDFTRWLPAIAKDSYRKTALSVVGVAALGGLALAPTAAAAPVTSGPHQGAVAAIDLATGKAHGKAATPARQEEQPIESGLTTGSATGKPPAGKPSRDELIPHGIEGAQSRVPLDDAQLANARAIVDAARKTGVGDRGAVIGVATSLQESKLKNLGHLGDAQRPRLAGPVPAAPVLRLGHPRADHRPEVRRHRVLQGTRRGRRLAGHAADRRRADRPGVRLPGRVRAVGGAGRGHRPADLVTPATRAGRPPSREPAGSSCPRTAQQAG